MAQTRKKRRSKHRGTAAGTIEARGRTGRRPSDQERGGKGDTKQDARERREARMARPPSWQRAATRALFATLLLFVLTRVGLGKITIGASIVLCVLAMVMYIPLGYALDSFVYRRYHKRKAAA